ncbi:MAG TPA: dienelactone hydrolase family protein [Acidimicrobiales bacterium]
MRLRSIVASAGGGLAVVALALASLVASPTAAGAQSNPYERGPDPTASSIRASRGPFATSSTAAIGVSGFGGGRVYYPTTTSEGTFGAVIIAPGFTAGSEAYLTLAQRVASHGFVAFAIDTNTRFDFPDSRGRQILAAVDWLTQRSSVRDRIDASRVAVSGHSMGGGGTLAAANSRPSLRAAVALQPWHTTKSWSRLQVPTMIIGAQNDTVAPVASHSEPFYNSIPASTEKAYVELRGESHFAGNTNPDDQGAAMVTWLKRYVDNDTRYEPFMCPPPSSLDYSEWRHTCPGGDQGSGGSGGGGTPGTPPSEECEWWEWWCSTSARTDAA